LDQSKFGANLNPFEINLIRFESRIGRTMLPTPPISAAPTASLRRTQPLMIGPLRAPAHLSAALAASRRPSRPPLSGGSAPMTCRRTAPRSAQGPLSLPHSLLLCLHAASTLWAPSPPLSIKTEPPPTGRRFFSPRAPFVSPVHA
jgi:hypothetical protein